MPTHANDKENEMNGLLWRPPSVALVIACLTMLLTLGCMSYATSLAANSVGVDQLRGASVAPSVSDGAIKGQARMAGGWVTPMHRRPLIQVLENAA
jgi:hypothetical protein